MIERTGEARNVAANVAEKMGWRSAAFPDACCDVAALMAIRARREHVGAVPLWDTATHVLAALGTVIMAGEGDTDAVRRVKDARAFLDGGEYSDIGQCDFGAFAVPGVTGLPERERKAAAAVAAEAAAAVAAEANLEPAAPEPAAPEPATPTRRRRSRLSRDAQRQIEQAYAMRLQGITWRAAANSMGIPHVRLYGRVELWAKRTGRPWPVKPQPEPE